MNEQEIEINVPDAQIKNQNEFLIFKNQIFEIEISLNSFEFVCYLIGRLVQEKEKLDNFNFKIEELLHLKIIQQAAILENCYDSLSLIEQCFASFILFNKNEANNRFLINIHELSKKDTLLYCSSIYQKRDIVFKRLKLSHIPHLDIKVNNFSDASLPIEAKLVCNENFGIEYEKIDTFLDLNLNLIKLIPLNTLDKKYRIDISKNIKNIDLFHKFLSYYFSEHMSIDEEHVDVFIDNICMKYLDLDNKYSALDYIETNKKISKIFKDDDNLRIGFLALIYHLNIYNTFNNISVKLSVLLSDYFSIGGLSKDTIQNNCFKDRYSNKDVFEEYLNIFRNKNKLIVS